MSGVDGLREQIAAWLFAKVIHRDGLIKLQWPHLERPQRDGWLEWADELLALPVVTAYAERVAGQRAAEELRAAAEEIHALAPDLDWDDWLRDRAAALADDGQP